MMNDILQACIFLGASLTINGYDQGTITAMDAELADQYQVTVSGTNWLDVRGWECGQDRHGHYVRISASVDNIAPPVGGSVSMIYLEATEPTDVCGNEKAIWCP